MRWLLSFFLVYLLFFSLGCVSSNKASAEETQPNQSTPPTEEEPKPPQSQVEENLSEEEEAGNPAIYFQYQRDVNASLRIHFIDVGSSSPIGEVDPFTKEAFSGFIAVNVNEKDGRAIIIEKGDFHALIYSVPEEKYNYFKGKLDELGVDDIEVLIVPSAYPTSLETLPKALAELKVGKVLLPKANVIELNHLRERLNAMGIPYQDLETGDSLEFNGITFEVLSPTPGEYSNKDINNNALSLRIKDRSFKAVFFLDTAPTGLAQQVVVHNIDKESRRFFDVDLLEVPLYGRSVSPVSGSVGVGYVLREYPIKYIVIDGSKPKPVDNDPYGNKDVIRFIEEILRKKAYKIWEKELHIEYDGSSIKQLE